MKLEVSYITNLEKLRRRNEDALLVGKQVIAGVSFDEPQTARLEGGSFLLAVADGMGGLPCGDRASRAVLESLKDEKITSPESLKRSLERAKAELDEFARTNPGCVGLGTALAGVYLRGLSALVFNVGDCRVYRLREDLSRLTKDHTEAYELFESGEIDEEGLRHHPLRNVLTSALVGGLPEDFEVFWVELDVRAGDTYLLCSDGLWDELSYSQMKGCLKGDVALSARCLFEEAYRGGRDNISFILFRVP